MTNSFFFLLTAFWHFFPLLNNPVTQPSQPLNGPGGAEYSHQSVHFQDCAQLPEGYWLFEPADPKPDSAHVVVFVHGYGGYNPMIYGKWIRHLVRKGNIVIYPRYQESMFSPTPDSFAVNVSKAIRDALVELNKEGHVKPVVSNLAFVAHSYGGVVSANLAINYAAYGIPKPQALLLCSPGTGMLKAGRLESYAAMPADVHLLVMVSEHDKIVGDEFGKKLFAEAVEVPQRNFLRQFPDAHGEPQLTAEHNESYSLDTLYDCGVRNFTSKRALRVSTEDAVDYYGYWKLLDALLDCNRSGTNCEFAFGNTPQQSSLGNWSDGTPVRALEVTLPED